MGDDELRRHLADILACCGVPAGQANTVAVNRLRLVVDMATRGLLARLPPDDDGEDHSPDWLVSIGGKSQLDGSVAFFGPEPGDGRIPLLWIDVYPGGRTAVRLITDAGMMSHYLDRPTKGGIRRLLSALGVG